MAGFSTIFADANSCEDSFSKDTPPTHLGVPVENYLSKGMFSVIQKKAIEAVLKSAPAVTYVDALNGTFLKEKSIIVVKTVDTAGQEKYWTVNMPGPSTDGPSPSVQAVKGAPAYHLWKTAIEEKDQTRFWANSDLHRMIYSVAREYLEENSPDFTLRIKIVAISDVAAAELERVLKIRDFEETSTNGHLIQVTVHNRGELGHLVGILNQQKSIKASPDYYQGKNSVYAEISEVFPHLSSREIINIYEDYALTMLPPSAYEQRINRITLESALEEAGKLGRVRMDFIRERHANFLPNDIFYDILKKTGTSNSRFKMGDFEKDLFADLFLAFQKKQTFDLKHHFRVHPIRKSDGPAVVTELFQAGFWAVKEIEGTIQVKVTTKEELIKLLQVVEKPMVRFLTVVGTAAP
jgi:hypothetical protein